MKKILTPKLTLQHLDLPLNGPSPGHYAHTDGTWAFCHDELLEYFDLPPETDTIQFEARRERFPDSMKVKFGSILLCDKHTPMLTLEDDVKVFLFPGTHYDIDTVLGKRRRVWYVKLYYWEKS